MIDEGYDTLTWERLPTFSDRCATPEDVDSGNAVFALGETVKGRPLPMPLPQPVIWWADEGEVAGVAVQAEAHETEDGDPMEVVGVVLPDGGTIVVLLEDVDLVESTDPFWRDLVEGVLDDEEDEEEEDAGSLAPDDSWDEDSEDDEDDLDDDEGPRR
jgi:hypothetical protein